MMSGAKKRAPKRRFKEFLNAGDWEQRKLGDIATFSKGNGYSKSDLVPSGSPIILYGRLYTNYETTIKNVDTFVELKDKSVISQGGEVIVPASGETAEDISRASVVENQGIVIGGDLNVIKVKELLHPTFLALTISNGEQQKELSKRAQGKSVVHLHNSDLQEVNLIFPLLHEQKEISILFEKIDNIITLHQRKLDKLQATKKALLQEMFPEEGQDKPKRRFKGFTDAWEQRKLRNLLEQPITDGPHETPELYDSGIPFISVDAIVDNKIDFTKMRGYISKEYDDICAKKYKPQINDVYLVKSGATIGKVAIVETYDNFNIWSPLAAMRCGSITNPYFLYMLLQTPDLQSQVFNKASHGTQPNLSMRQLETFTCKVPKIEEQKLISRFLKQLDDVITLHQHKLDKLKNLKQAYLNEMFV